jgi:hypothetical protein
MPILTDPSATYSANDVFTPAKTNAVARLATTAWQYVIAQWGTEIDNGLIAINEWIHGDAAAGTAGKVFQLLGGSEIAEKLGISGGLVADIPSDSGIAVGTTSDASTNIQLQTSNVGTGSLLFSDAADLDAAGFVCDHSADTMTMRVGGSNIFGLTVDGLVPSANTTYNVGLGSYRIKKVWTADLDVRSTGNFGSGAAAFDLVIDGGAALGQEPRLAFANAGVLTAGVRLSSSGDLEAQNAGGLVLSLSDALTLPKMSTATREALTDVSGKVVYDTTVGRIYWNDGAAWYKLQTGYQPRAELLTANNVHFPAANFAAIFHTTGGHQVVSYANAAISSAGWYFRLPEDYDGGNVTLTMYWTGFGASVLTVDWSFTFNTFALSDDLTLAGSPAAVTTSPAGPAIAQTLLVTTVTLTNADLDGAAAGSVCRILAARNGITDAYASTVGILAITLVETP